MIARTRRRLPWSTFFRGGVASVGALAAGISVLAVPANAAPADNLYKSDRVTCEKTDTKITSVIDVKRPKPTVTTTTTGVATLDGQPYDWSFENTTPAGRSVFHLWRHSDPGHRELANNDTIALPALFPGQWVVQTAVDGFPYRVERFGMEQRYRLYDGRQTLLLDLSGPQADLDVYRQQLAALRAAIERLPDPMHTTTAAARRAHGIIAMMNGLSVGTGVLVPQCAQNIFAFDQELMPIAATQVEINDLMAWFAARVGNGIVSRPANRR